MLEWNHSEERENNDIMGNNFKSTF